MNFHLRVRSRPGPRHRLDLARIAETAKNLAEVIRARLPDSNLADLSDELVLLVDATNQQLRRASRPIIAIRAASCAAVSAGILGLWYIVDHLHTRWGFATITDFFQATDAAFNLMILIAGALWYLITLESRLKRKEILIHIGELREFAHVIDLTQLYHTPDLYAIRSDSSRTPQIIDDMYLLFCTQLLSVLGNLAPLYTRNAADDSILRAASEVEMLTNAIISKHFSKAETVRRINPRPGPPGTIETSGEIQGG